MIIITDLYSAFRSEDTEALGHDIIQRQITRKWYKIEIYLQWPTNRKSYMFYQTAPFSMILNDP